MDFPAPISSTAAFSFNDLQGLQALTVVVKFNLAKLEPKAAYDKLYASHKLAIAQTAAGDAKGLRFSPHVYNTMEEIDRAVAAVREIAG